MGITALTIVKNEENNIARSINSYKEAVDEIIIVDTGSTDNTVEICKKLGCKVFYYDWNNNFAEARNFALSKANNEWILFLDADEYFMNPLTGDFKKCIIELENNNVNMVKILTYNIDSITKERLHTAYGLKLFKKKGVKYKRPIHEALVFIDSNENGVLLNDFPLIHTGYSSDIKFDKPIRNLEILRECELNGTLETKDYYYLTRECLILDENENARKYLDLFFKQPDYEKEIKEMDIGYLIYSFKYILMCRENATYEEKKEYLLNIITKYDIPDFYFYLGNLYLEEDYTKAHEYLLKTIECDNRLSNTDRYSNYCSYEPKIYYLLAKIEYIKKNNQKALLHIMVACMLDRNNKIFLGLLLRICNRYSSKKIIKLLYKIYNPSTKEGYEFIVEGLVNTNLYETFKYFAKRYNVEYGGGHTAVFMSMILDKQIPLVIKTALNIYKENKDTYYLFIIMIALLYLDDKNTYLKYYQDMNNIYKNIINWMLDKNKYLSKEEYHEYINIIIRLIYLGNTDYLKTLDISLINNKDLLRIFTALENVCDYKNIIKIFEKNKNIEDIDVIGEYLLALYMTDKKDTMIKEFNCYKEKGVNLERYRYLYCL